MIALAASITGVTLVVAFALWRFLYFHRNPPRTVPAGTDPVCPADGRILYVQSVDLGESADNYHQRVKSAFAIDGSWRIVATHLGIFDVHVVRAPIGGVVALHHMEPLGSNASMGEAFVYRALRRPLPVGRRDYMHKNEFLGVEIDGDARVLLVLMADWWIDQIVPLVDHGARVERGQAIGRIQMGSQVDLWVMADRFAPIREVGDRVRAGAMIVGRTLPDSRG